MKKLIGLAICTSAACTSSNSVETVTVAATAATTGPAVVTVTFDQVNDTLIASDSSSSVTMTRFSSNDTGRFLGYGNNSADLFAFRAVSDGSEVTLAVGEGLGGTASVEYQRLTAADLPTAGSIDYAGDYVSSSFEENDFDSGSGVTGDISLTADFAAMTVTGTINNRVIVNAEGLSEISDTMASDLTFAIGAIDSTGAFTGTLEPGATYQDGQITFNGTGSYEGLISGQDADEAVGSVNTTWTRSDGGSSFTELGVFILEETQP